MADTKHYWFPARTYGWGWGLPTSWHGWLVYGIATVLLIAGTLFVRPLVGTLFFQIYICGVLLSLIVVCWVKGEPPRWRWGK